MQWPTALSLLPNHWFKAPKCAQPNVGVFAIADTPRVSLKCLPIIGLNA
jgi:hypothetical protein